MCLLNMILNLHVLLQPLIEAVYCSSVVSSLFVIAPMCVVVSYSALVLLRVFFVFFLICSYFAEK